jgi:Uma2 family endonuclease
MLVRTKATPSTIRMPATVTADMIWRLRVDQYHEMIRKGILTDDDPVELLEGWLVTKMPKNPSHRVTTQLTRKALEALLPEGWYVDTQEPITLSDSEPEPDVVIVRGKIRHYSDRHPGAQDVALIVEVADTTLQRDQGAKKLLYAREGIPVYWIINLIEQQIEIYTEPSESTDTPDYQHYQIYQSSETVPVIVDDDTLGEIAVREFLP